MDSLIRQEKLLLKYMDEGKSWKEIAKKYNKEYGCQTRLGDIRIRCLTLTTERSKITEVWPSNT